jgi:hypothetical protein
MDNKAAELDGHNERADGDAETDERRTTTESDNIAVGLPIDETDFPSAQQREITANDADETWTKVKNRASKRHASGYAENAPGKRMTMDNNDTDDGAPDTADGRYITSKNNETSNEDPTTAENSDNENSVKSLILKRNKQSRIRAQPHRTDATNNNCDKQICDKNKTFEKQTEVSASVAAARPTVMTRMELDSIAEQVEGGPLDANFNVGNDEHQSATGAANANMLNNKYHWYNTGNAGNIERSHLVLNDDKRTQAEAILAQTTGIFVRVLRVIHNESVVDRLFQPEKSSADAAEYITYFEGRFREAIDELTAKVHVSTRNLPNGTEEEQTELLTELVLMKEKIQNQLIRIRAESAGAFAASQKYDRAVAYRQLSDYGAISEKQNRIFNELSTALAGIHYAKLLEDIQRKIIEVRSTLPNHRVLYATIAQQSVRNSRNKVDKLFRRLRPDMAVGPADTRQCGKELGNIREQTRIGARQHNSTNAHGYAQTAHNRKEDIAHPRTDTWQNSRTSQNAQSEHARTRTSAHSGTTKPKQTYAQTVGNSGANANSRPHETIHAQSAQTENIHNRADEQTTKSKILAAQAKRDDSAQQSTCDVNANIRNTSLLGRPPQHATNSVQTDPPADNAKPNGNQRSSQRDSYRALRPPRTSRNDVCAYSGTNWNSPRKENFSLHTDWPADTHKPIQKQYYGERGHYRAGWAAGRSWNEPRAHNGTNWDGPKGWRYNSWAGPAAQRYVPNWAGRSWYTSDQHAYRGPRCSSSVQTKSNLQHNRGRMSQKFYGPYIGYADQVGRW